MVIPYAPSAGWYAVYLQSRLAGEGEDVAVRKANESLSDNKAMARCRISGSQGTQTLSVPLEGGSGVLKRRDGVYSAMLSSHGRWRDVHLGAISAAYGRAPFYPYLADRLESVFRDEKIKSLRQLSLALHVCITEFLDMETFVKALSGLSAFPSEIKDAASGLREKTDLDLSILDVVFKLGRDALIALI